MAKKDFGALVRSAVKNVPVSLDDRFTRASATLTVKPTGYIVAEEQTNVAQPEVAKNSAVYYADVPIGDLAENPFNARRIYRQERIEKLAVSMASQGQLVPGIATLRDGQIILVAGHYRFRALKLAGIPEIGVMIHPRLTDQQMYEISLKENNERDDQSALDNALAWRDLIDDGVYADEEALAAAIGLSRPTVHKTLAILKLSEDCLEIVRQEPGAFALTALYELTQLENVAGIKVAVEVANQLYAGDIGRKEVQLIRERYHAPKDRKKKESSRQYRILGNDGKEVGSIKDFTDGRVVLNVCVADTQERESLIDALKGRFKIA